MKKRILSLAMVAMLMISLCAMLTACGGSNDGLAGTKWTLSGGEMAGVEVTAEQLQAALGDCTMEFKSGGKVSLVAAGQTSEGTYTVDGDTIKMTDDSGAEIDIAKSGDTLTMTQDFSGSAITMTFKKQ